MNPFPEPTGPNPKFPCGICKKTIAKNHRKIRCYNCNYRYHIKCNKTDVETYNKIKHIPQLCIICYENSLPFQTLTDDQFIATVTKGSNSTIETNSSLFPSTSMKNFFKEINSYNQANSDLNHKE